MSIGISANAPLSIAIIDENGVKQSTDVLNKQSLFLCFDLALLKRAFNQLGLPFPSKIIDLKVELCLLANIIEKRTDISYFNLALHEMALAHRVETVAPDGGMWLHPCQQINQQAESNVLAIRHASWVMLLWQKYQSDFKVEQALYRSHYCHSINEISGRGFPLDLVAINQPTSIEEINCAKKLLKVSSNGRCFSPVKPYATTTGRNSTSSNQYPLSIKAELRKWIKPSENRCLIHLDFYRQEIGIAAALSLDINLLDLYQHGDPYAWFAKQCEYEIELKKAKRAFIAFQYGAKPSIALAKKMSLPANIVMHLHTIHQATFKQYWLWTDAVIENAFADGYLSLPDGWRARVTKYSSLLSIINWPIQATGAQLLRNVVCELGQHNVYPIGLNHDAVVLECSSNEATELGNKAKTLMQVASRQLLGLELGVSIDIGQPGQSLFDVLE